MCVTCGGIAVLQGKLVCADYGRLSDYKLLRQYNISLNGTIVIIQHSAVDISPLVEEKYSIY